MWIIDKIGSTAKPRGKRPRGKRTSLGSDFEFPKKNLRYAILHDFLSDFRQFFKVILHDFLSNHK